MSFRFIFETRVRPGEDEAFIRNWHDFSVPIQKYPGARGTRLHTKRGEEHVYIAIAEWNSREAREAAMADIRKNESDLAQQANAGRQNEDYGEVTVLAEVDEIDIVMPPGGQTA